MAAEKPKVVRLLMIGDSSVGKTSLVLRFDENSFSHKFVTTIGVDYRDKLIDLKGTPVKVQIWDTAGQERFRSLTSNFFSRADGLVLSFDVTSRSTFDGVRTWFNEIQEKADPEARVVLCATKCDMASDRDVTAKEGQDLARDLGLEYFETSAKTGNGVQEMFLALAEQAHDFVRRNRADSAPQTVTQPGESGAKGKQGGCC